MRELSEKTGLPIEDLISSNPQLQMLSTQQKVPKAGVWANDDIPPSSHIYSHKSRVMYEWSPTAMSRLLYTSGLLSLEVHAHSDGSLFYVRENGTFITHLESNLTSIKALRSFTCDTIPFSVPALLEGENINPQVVLATAFTILQQPQPDTKIDKLGMQLEEKSSLQKALHMSAPSPIVHESRLDDLANLTAYENQSVKANFSDRTIIRM